MPATRAERDALRAEGRSTTARDERPAPPWGSFPLSELLVLLALVAGVWGFFTFDTDRGKAMVLAAMALGSLGGLEISVREHFAGYRSHSTLLAAAAGVATMVGLATALALVFDAGALGYTAAFVTGLVAALLAFRGLRQAFRARTGGVSFR